MTDDKSNDADMIGSFFEKIEWEEHFDKELTMGWVCPVCGRGIAPFMAQCPCNGNRNFEITCGGEN